MNDICDLQETAPGDWRCVRCGRTIQGVFTAGIIATCKRQRPVMQCAHLGNVLRSVGCQSCGGSITLDVFACAKFGEATKEKRAPDVGGCCKGCAYFEEAPAEIPPRWPPADEWLLYVPPGAGVPEAAYLLSCRDRAGMMHDRIFEVFYRLDHTEYDRLVLCIVGGEQMESAAVELRCSTTGHIGPRWSSGPLSPGASARRMTLKADDGRLGDVLAEPAS